MKEIHITEIENVKIGNAENKEAATGCTVVMCENGARVGLDVRGGGPASRESDLLNPVANAEIVHAVLLSGGSAFGLDAAGGVMQYLEEHDVGYYVGVAKVPLVCQSCLFDLSVGSPNVRPDKAMGYEACQNAEKNNYSDGNFGAGTGATVGKLYGTDCCMKSGIGSYAVQIGELKIGAIVAVNAWGDVFDYKTGKKLAGLLDKDKKSFRSTADEILKSYSVVENKFVSNTTIGIIITNAEFDKVKLKKIASMAHNGYARSINPLNTGADGDSIYAMSIGSVTADQDMVGTLAAQVMSEAITRAVMSAKSEYGHIAAKDM
jgi:L-aminopeptidase/D-esterase-like protein